MFIQPIALSQSEMQQITEYEQQLIREDRADLSDSLLAAANQCQKLIASNGLLAAEIQKQAEQLEAADLRIQTLKEQNQASSTFLQTRGDGFFKFVRNVGPLVAGGAVLASGFGAPFVAAAATTCLGVGQAGSDAITEATHEEESCSEETEPSDKERLRFNQESYFLDVQDLTQEKAEMAGLLARLLLSINQNDLQEQALNRKQKQNNEDLTAKAHEENELLKKLNAKGIIPILASAAGKLPSYVGAHYIYDKAGAVSTLFSGNKAEKKPDPESGLLKENRS